ncbi:hypothetical protein BKI52_42960 [marine bacterium AO1-C]|nr:hypothetical protein BKI52_42960 [marine bacterium AO1-C]
MKTILSSTFFFNSKPFHTKTNTMNQINTQNSFTPKVPTAKGRFIMGNVQDFKASPVGFFKKLETFKTPVVKFRLAHIHCYYLASQEAVQQVLVKNNKNYLKGGPFMETNKKIVGNGLAFSDKELWQRQRRIMAPVFHKKCIDSFFKLMLDFTDQFVENIGQEKSALDVHKHFNQLTMDIATQALFGTEVKKDETDTLMTNFQVLVEESIRRTTNGFSLPFWIPTPANQKLKKAIKAYDTTMVNIIKNKIKQPGHTMLDLLIQAKDPESGEAMNPQQLIDEVRIFFAAGTETSANALTWTTYLLSQHPEKMKQLRLEIQRVLGDNPPTLEVLEQLPYLDQIVKESLRLYPPAWISSRTNEYTDSFSGLEIPAGSNIFYSAYMLQRNPAYWTHANSFMPERFAPENQPDLPLQAFIPFGAGPRKCIGDRFALMEIKIILIRLLQNYHWELKTGFQPKPAFLGTLQAQEGMWVMFVSRKG